MTTVDSNGASQGVLDHFGYFRDQLLSLMLID
jgi:hypothetical protein